MLDRRPFFWALGIVAVVIAVMAGFHFIGTERLHNTTLWQRFHPVTLVSPAQTARTVDVQDADRVTYAVVQTEKGLYFITGTRHLPADGAQVVVQANDAWELFLCSADGTRCMTIHSFCAGAVWPELKRDEKGKVEGCHASHLAAPAQTERPDRPPQIAALPGGRSKRKGPPPAVGISHPAEWAGLMGLPVPAPTPLPPTQGSAR